MTIKGSLLCTCPMLKAFRAEYSVPLENAPKWRFWGQRGEKLNFWFCDLQKAHNFDVFCVKIRAGVLAVDDLNTPSPPQKKNEQIAE